MAIELRSVCVDGAQEERRLAVGEQRRRRMLGVQVLEPVRYEVVPELCVSGPADGSLTRTKAIKTATRTVSLTSPAPSAIHEFNDTQRPNPFVRSSRSNFGISAAGVHKNPVCTRLPSAAAARAINKSGTTPTANCVASSVIVCEMDSVVTDERGADDK